MQALIALLIWISVLLLSARMLRDASPLAPAAVIMTVAGVVLSLALGRVITAEANWVAMACGLGGMFSLCLPERFKIVQVLIAGICTGLAASLMAMSGLGDWAGLGLSLIGLVVSYAVLGPNPHGNTHHTLVVMLASAVAILAGLAADLADYLSQLATASVSENLNDDITPIPWWAIVILVSALVGGWLRGGRVK